MKTLSIFIFVYVVAVFSQISWGEWRPRPPQTFDENAEGDADLSPGSVMSRGLAKAVRVGDEKIVRKLLDDGADVDTRDLDELYNRTVLHAAVLKNHVNIVSLLLSRSANVNLQDRFGDTPLHAAAYAGSTNLVSMLLAHNASVNIQGYGRFTPLHYAAEMGSAEIASILLNNSANIEATDVPSRMTPLHVASLNGHQSVVLILVERGANVFAQDLFKATPLASARRENQTEIVEILQRKERGLSA